MSVNRIGNMAKRDIYILVIDSICKQCGFRNKGSYRLEEDMDIVCCGKCGAFIHAPEDITEEDRESVRKVVEDAIEEAENGTDTIDM